MPIYEYQCQPCRVIYETQHGMNEQPLQNCPTCGGAVSRLISAPRVNIRNYSGPTEAKYAKMSKSEEIAREQILQKDFQRMWLPPAVKDNPWSG